MTASRSTSSKGRGFAYVWTLMLVGLLGVGSVIASELYATSVRRERERELLFIGHEFRAALERYNKAGGQQAYPQTLAELLRDPRFPGTKRYLRRLYKDPMTGKAEWGTVVMQGRIVGVYSLSALAPIKQDNFEEADSNLRNKQHYSDWRFVYPADLFVPPTPTVQQTSQPK